MLNVHFFPYLSGYDGLSGSRFFKGLQFARNVNSREVLDLFPVDKRDVSCESVARISMWTQISRLPWLVARHHILYFIFITVSGKPCPKQALPYILIMIIFIVLSLWRSEYVHFLINFTKNAKYKTKRKQHDNNVNKWGVNTGKKVLLFRCYVLGKC